MASILALLLGASVPEAQTTSASSVLRISRCRPNSPSPCVLVRASASTPSDQGPALRIGRQAQPAIGWRAEEVALLILVDVSGSMAGARMAQLRIALRKFVSELPSDRVRVSVVPFGSRGVESGIGAARYVDPARAGASVDALPEPDPRANTALYSAAAYAAEVAAAAVASAPRTRPALLVLTDGVNDVQPGDDAGLLAGQLGREEARRRIEASGTEVWALGAGAGVRADELAALFGREHLVLTGQDMRAARLDSALGTAGAQVLQLRQRVFTFASSQWRQAARGPIRVAVDPGDGSAPSVLTWTPPLLALPAFDGFAFDRPVGPLARWARRGQLASMGLLVVALVIFLTAPRAGRKSTGAKQIPVIPRAVRGVTNSSLRARVVEVAPRDAGVVTAEPQSRVVTLPGRQSAPAE